MGTSFLPYDPNQLYLLPPSVLDWLPEGRLALRSPRCRRLHWRASWVTGCAGSFYRAGS
jgi:hypothetical protein